MRRIASAGLALVLIVGAWGLLEAHALLDVQEHPAPIPALPAAWEGRRFAVLGDWQIGIVLDNEGRVERAVSHILARRPAFVLLLGDFIYRAEQDPGDELASTAELLRPLTGSGIPVFAVLGNHDWGLGSRAELPDTLLARRVRATLEEAGVQVLHNEARRLSAGGASLYLIGVGSRWAGMDDVAAALAGVPNDAPRVAFMHHPDTFERFRAGAAPLAVAGHTHGGQIRVPGLPQWTWLTYVRSDRVHADGWIDEEFGARGNRLYVNRGIGMSAVPLRINCPPELTYFTLRAGTDGATPTRPGA